MKYLYAGYCRTRVIYNYVCTRTAHALEQGVQELNNLARYSNTHLHRWHITSCQLHYCLFL